MHEFRQADREAGDAANRAGLLFFILPGRLLCMKLSTDRVFVGRLSRARFSGLRGIANAAAPPPMCVL